MLLRPVRPEDEPLLRLLLEMRMGLAFSASPAITEQRLPASEVASLTQIDFDRQMTIIAVCEDADECPRIIGVGHSITDPNNIRAGLMLAVRRDLQGRGFERLLLEKMLRYLRGRATSEVELCAENATEAVARSLGFVDCTQNNRPGKRLELNLAR